ncbi:MAG: hypothetical protein UU93_C0008G0013 [Candidatus Amesbacteria bacterium GW2011_GWA2_42_12]|uniref:OmpR/PhoB-type domain-containing protein n=1 Tax=Candidatus Amesbacteria bacterium GW2011_GWA2_42_12 TaxID=1618356 RepID=A0A0G1ADQ1_9BACT|nr:MAG: hypothetical protein UU93_C0008G0013 [Candidatus Amesbacteria bacterium GW2011_GWA2_42_12]
MLLTHLLQTPAELLQTIKDSSERNLIVIDSLDRILNTEHRALFNYLKALRDSHKYHLAYVFLCHAEIKANEILDDLEYLVSEHIEHLPPLTSDEYDLFGFQPTPKQLKQLIELSGGIPALVKVYVLAMRDGQSLDSTQNPQIAAMLVKTGKTKLSQLTAAETRLMDLFLTNRGQIVSKNQICDVVYPDVKNKAGISDHALDQLVHRLRVKIKNQYTLTTHRGLGYKLS